MFRFFATGYINSGEIKIWKAYIHFRLQGLCLIISTIKTVIGGRILLTSRLHFDFIQPSFYRMIIDIALHQHFRLQQRDAALLEVVDDRIRDVLTFVGVHRHHRCQAPLQSTPKTVTSR